MRIRHVLEGQDHYAAYVMKRQPYGALLKLTDRCLVTRGEDEDGNPKDEIVGFVINDKGYNPADEVSEGTRFLGYTTVEMLTFHNTSLKQYLAQLQQWGQDWAARSQPTPAQVEALFEEPDLDTEPEQPRKRRGR